MTLRIIAALLGAVLAAGAIAVAVLSVGCAEFQRMRWNADGTVAERNGRPVTYTDFGACWRDFWIGNPPFVASWQTNFVETATNKRRQ